MAERRLLHKTKLADFKNWLCSDGWRIEDTKGYYEVLRARKGKGLFILYKRLDRGDHYSVMEKDVGVIRAFIRDSKEANNGYAWHISNLVIYDKPKELSEFHKRCNDIYGCGAMPPLTRPPQNWCYVEESEVKNDL